MYIIKNLPNAKHKANTPQICKPRILKLQQHLINTK